MGSIASSALGEETLRAVNHRRYFFIVLLCSFLNTASTAWIPNVMTLFTTTFLQHSWKVLVSCRQAVSYTAPNNFGILPTYSSLYSNHKKKMSQYVSSLTSVSGMGGRKGRDGLFPATSCIKIAGYFGKAFGERRKSGESQENSFFFLPFPSWWCEKRKSHFILLFSFFSSVSIFFLRYTQKTTTKRRLRSEAVLSTQVSWFSYQKLKILHNPLILYRTIRTLASTQPSLGTLTTDTGKRRKRRVRGSAN